MARKKEGRPRVRVRAAASLVPPRRAPPSAGLGSSELHARRRVPAAQASPAAAAAVAQADLRVVAVEQR